MTRGGRALLGAALGAALTLFLHPASRPYLTTVFISPTSHSTPVQRGIPDDPVQLSDWMSAIGERFLNRQKLTRVELDNAILAATKGAKLNADNPFWHQMLACFYHQIGDEEEAKHQWITASACARWNDFQTEELLREHQRLTQDFKAAQSWQLAYVYFQRTESAVKMISSYGHSIYASIPLASDEGLPLRAANVINGMRLREGSQSIRIGYFGTDMSEMACHPSGLSETLSRHKLFLAHIRMQDRLRQLGHQQLADQVYDCYRQADAWYVYENPVEAESNVAELSFLSLFLSGFPSMLTVVGITGIVLWLTGIALRKLEHIPLLPALVAGLLLAIGAYSITLLPLAAITTFLCCAFLTLGPKRERSVKIDDLGPMFSFTAGTLGLVFMLLFGAFVVGTSAPAVSILPFLSVPHEYFGGSGVLLGLSIIVLAILLLLAPMFAIALRVSTGFVLSKALRKFGAFLAYASLGLIVVGTPLCIYFDRDNSETLRRIVTNEPVYYLNLNR
jgi:hypothetical protein